MVCVFIICYCTVVFQLVYHEHILELEVDRSGCVVLDVTGQKHLYTTVVTVDGAMMQDVATVKMLGSSVMQVSVQCFRDT